MDCTESYVQTNVEGLHMQTTKLTLIFTLLTLENFALTYSFKGYQGPPRTAIYNF